MFFLSEEDSEVVLVDDLLVVELLRGSTGRLALRQQARYTHVTLWLAGYGAAWESVVVRVLFSGRPATNLSAKLFSMQRNVFNAFFNLYQLIANLNLTVVSCRKPSWWVLKRRDSVCLWLGEL